MNRFQEWVREKLEEKFPTNYFDRTPKMPASVWVGERGKEDLVILLEKDQFLRELKLEEWTIEGKGVYFPEIRIVEEKKYISGGIPDISFEEAMEYFSAPETTPTVWEVKTTRQLVWDGWTVWSYPSETKRITVPVKE